MWQMIWMEYKYNYYFFVAVAVLAAVTALNTVFQPLEDFPMGVMAFNLPLIVTTNWLALRTKNKRERQWGGTPILVWQRGVARAYIWLGTGLLWIVLYHGLVQIFAAGHHSSAIMAAVALLWIMVAVYMTVRDCLLDFLRHNPVYPLTPERSKSLIMMLILFLNFFGVMAFLSPRLIGGWLIGTIKFLAHHWLLNSWNGSLILMAVALVLTMLTVFTYSRKKSYLE